MATVYTRNRSKGKLDKNGKAKTPNWEYRFESAAIDGKRKQITKGGFSTKGEAVRAGTKALAEYNNTGNSFDPTDISVSDYMDYWLDNYCKFNIADSTMAAYRNIVKNHIKPRIGNYRLKSVDTMTLQSMINSIYVDRGFTKDFMKNIMKVIKGSFKYACVTAKLIPTNPSADVSLPKIKSNPDQEEIIILSKENINKIFERFECSKYQYYAMLTAYYTGFRVAEVYGLTWDNVDFKNKTITVDKNAKKIERNGFVSDGKRKRGIRGKASTRWYFGECKTPTSYRTIEVGDTLLNVLKEYKDWQDDNEKEYQEFYTKIYAKDEVTETNRNVKRLIQMQDTGVEVPLERVYPVFIKENGEFSGTDSMKYVSKVVNYDLGIKFNFHAFRHTHATMLIESGVPVKVVSERLGHSNTRTTLDTYVHVTETMENDAVNKFEKIGDLNDRKVIGINEKKRKTKVN